MTADPKTLKLATQRTLSTAQAQPLLAAAQEQALSMGRHLAIVNDDCDQVVLVQYHRDSRLPIETIWHAHWRSHRSPQRTGYTLDFDMPKQAPELLQCLTADAALFHQLGLSIYAYN